MYDAYDSYDSVPSQSTFDPFMLMLMVPVGILICFMFSCIAFICGAGMHIIEYCTKGKNIQWRSQTKPEYQQVAAESEREQVFGILLLSSLDMVFLICELFIFLWKTCKMSNN